MQRVLFHGSDHIVVCPQHGLGKPYNDYGQGFYCTESKDMACEWAVSRKADGFANEYVLDCEGLCVLDLNGPEYTLMHWLSVLLQNRFFGIRNPLAVEARQYIVQTFPVDFDGIDVVEGLRADDSYFSFAQDFISGSISYRQLGNAMRLGRLGRQVMLRSPRAFDRLTFVGATPAERSVWLPRREARDSKARKDYFDNERSARRKGDLFIAQIIDEEMGPNDDRLQ